VAQQAGVTHWRRRTQPVARWVAELADAGFWLVMNRADWTATAAQIPQLISRLDGPLSPNRLADLGDPLGRQASCRAFGRRASTHEDTVWLRVPFIAPGRRLYSREVKNQRNAIIDLFLRRRPDRRTPLWPTDHKPISTSWRSDARLPAGRDYGIMTIIAVLSDGVSAVS